MTDNVTPNNASTTNTATGSVLDQLVGDGKKFKSVEELAKGKIESDAFIQKVTDENKFFREAIANLQREQERLAARASILDRLGGTSSDQSGNPPAQTPTQTATPPAGLTADDVKSVIQQTQREEAAARNRAVVDAELAKSLGTEAVAFVRQKASELGFSEGELRDMAGKSPDAFFRLLGINRQNGTGNPIYAGGQTPPGTNQPVRNYAFYEAKRKQMGNIAYMGDKNLQLQIHKDMQALGDAFFNN